MSRDPLNPERCKEGDRYCARCQRKMVGQRWYSRGGVATCVACVNFMAQELGRLAHLGRKLHQGALVRPWNGAL